MMVYSMTPDYSGYKELDLRVNDFLDSFPEEFSYQEANRFDSLNLTLGSFWPKVSTGFDNIEGRVCVLPDISTWKRTCLVLSPNAFRYVEEELKAYGEFLPLWIDDEEWKIFNCLTIAEVIQDKTDQTHIVFDSKSVGNKMVFKCLYPYGVGIYCSDRFKQLVETYGLNGLKFSSSEARPIGGTDQTYSVI